MTNDMTQGSITKALIRFSVPLILSGILQQLYSWADAFIVGNIEGEAALAAIGTTGAVSGLFMTAITGFASGISILSATQFGTGEKEGQRKILTSFISVLGILAVLLSVLGILLTEQMMVLLGTPDEIFNMACSYMKIIFAGMPFMAVYNVYSAVLRGIGDSKTPFYSVILSSFANVVLDILLVGPLQMHVEGAAAATVLSQILMTVYVVWYSSGRYEILRFVPGKKMIDAEMLKKGFQLSWPITVQSLVSSAGYLILQNFMNSFGTATVAAITTAYRIDSIILLPVFNLGTGISTITAQNIGAKEYRRVRKCLTVGVVLTAAVSVALTVLVLLLGGSLIGLFGVNQEALQIGTEFFDVIAVFYVIFGASMAIRGYVEGSGKVLFSGICGIVTLIIRIALSYALRPIYGNMVIAYAESYAWCIQLILFAGYAVYLVRHSVVQKL